MNEARDDIRLSSRKSILLERYDMPQSKIDQDDTLQMKLTEMH